MVLTYKNYISNIYIKKCPYSNHNKLSILGTITSIGYGCVMAWTSPAITYLLSEKSYLPVSKEQSDKISSLLTVGYILGYILNPIIIGKLGGKRTLLIYTLPQTASWLFIIIAKNHVTIYIARILGGIGYGGAICALTVYLSEIGTSKTRGIFIVLLNLSMGLGFFFVMLLGASLPYHIMNLMFLSLPIIFLATFIFMPDSEYFMNEVEQEDQEMKVRLNFFSSEGLEERESGIRRGSDLIKDSTKKEDSGLKSDLNSGENYQDQKENSNGFNIRKSRLCKLLKLRNNQIALIIVISLAAQDVFSGHMALWSYTQQFLTYKTTPIEPEKATLVLASVKIIAAVLSAFIIERMGRKLIFLHSAIIGTIAQGLVGIFFFLEKEEVDLSSWRWWPLIGVSIYELSFATGSSNLFYLYQAELFSSEVKSVAVMTCKVSYMVFSYFCLFQFQVLLDAVGKPVIYLFFTICAAIGTVFVSIITPETQGKTIEEIQTILKSKKFFL